MRHFASLLSALLAVLLLAAVPADARTVVIDAGHGGHDRGGVPGQRYAEKIYTLDVARRLSSRLRSAGYRTVMTRNGDYFVDLRQRCSVANREWSPIFISIHFNSARNTDATGIETYYASRGSGALALAVHRRVVAATGSPDRRVRCRSFYVINHTRAPSILCELGFLTNRSEGGRIAGSSGYRQKLADAIARGVMSTYR